MESTTEIISKSALVRVLFEITTLAGPKENFIPDRPSIVIKKVDVFPLAFIYSEDCQETDYELISQSLHQEQHKLMENLPVCDPGVYELVGEFFGKFTMVNQKSTHQLWTLDEVKAYQLTDTEILRLPLSIREKLDAKMGRESV